MLVSQAVPMVETYLRQSDGTWLFSAWQGLEAIALLRTVGVNLPLAEAYRGLTFDVPVPPL